MKLNKGFTLVELLIVIALIGILSVAVLSTINPIEQANKANDAKNKNDAAEILSAVERYYTTKQEYPWMDAGFTDKVASVDTAVGFETADPGVGICQGTSIYGGACTGVSEGVLITTDELKTSFRDKTFLATTATAINKIYFYKGAGSALNVCFVPKAKANRTASATNPLYIITFTGGYPSALTKQITNGAGACPLLSDATSWEAIATACFVCVP